MLFSELYSQIQRRFGDAGMFFSETDAMDWVNEAQLNLSRESDYFSVTASPISVSTYLVSGILIPNNVLVKTVLFGKTPLEVKDYNIILGFLGTAVGTGRPKYWYTSTLGQDQLDPNKVRNEVLKVYPEPDNSQSDSFIVTYGAIPTKITNNNNPIDAPVSMHPAIMNFCLMRAHERNRDWQAMKLAQEAFDQDLSQRRYEGQQISEDWPSVTDVMGY